MVITNSIDNTIGASNSGATNTLTIQNPSNTASSQAQEIITVGGTSSGDPFTTYTVTGSNSFSVGIDNSASQLFKISPGTSLGVTAYLQQDASGNISILSSTGTTSCDLSSSVANQYLEYRVNNLSDTSGADSNFVATVAGTSSGDPQSKYVITGGQTWSAGSDNSDSDAYVVSANNGLGTNNVMHITTAGEVNFPLTPAFLAYLASTDSNVTGAGATYNVGTNVAWTEVFDQNSDFNTNGTFTAPVTGRYYLEFAVNVAQLGAANTTGYIGIITSNRSKNSFFMNWAAVRSVATTADAYAMSMTYFADMDAADTAVFQLTILGGAGNTVDISGGANTATSVAGFLQC